MAEGGGDSSTALVDVLDLAKNAISISGLKDAQVSHIYHPKMSHNCFLCLFPGFFCLDMIISDNFASIGPILTISSEFSQFRLYFKVILFLSEAQSSSNPVYISILSYFSSIPPKMKLKFVHFYPQQNSQPLLP